MTATVCPINPPGHDWQAGLACRWCDATRTPSEAVLSGLASVRGWSRDAARAVLDAYRAEVLAEAADYFEQRRLACADIVTHFDRGRRAAEGCMVEELRELAGEEATPAGATATPGLTVYRASHDAIVMGRYTTAQAAREHCETYARRESPAGVMNWVLDEPGEDDSVEELTVDGVPTGYVMTPLEVASRFDEEADE